ncbi:hypothetical protein F0562_033574 [Nyssa sinensis]|uniref:Pentatricopeptide repeat-containing protein n=1 Tax=Nyssa sinensis TaxID=561372 RepID=A0A5J5AFH3_9ASTE|nr:hypothetical protein F0562_033574 [Nyssa sinensis]
MEKSGLLISARNINQIPCFSGDSRTQKLLSKTSKFRSSPSRLEFSLEKLRGPAKRNLLRSTQHSTCCFLGVTVPHSIELSQSEPTILGEPSYVHGVAKILKIEATETSDAASEFVRRLVLVDLDPATAKLAIGFLGPFLSAFGFLFILRIVMSWYPKLPVGKFPFVIAYAPTEPLLIPTRKLIPPLGGVDVTPVVWFGLNSLVSAFANSGYVDFARKVFDEIMLKDTIAWTAMIDGYLRNDCAAEALECFLEMRLINVRVDEMTVVSVLGAAGMVGDVWFGRWVHGFYVESGRVHWDVYVGSALVDMYSKCGYCDDAFSVFNEMPVRNVVSWSVMIAGYVQCNRFNDAVMVFQDMLLEEVEPSQYTLTSVLTACAQLGGLNLGRWVHGYIDMNKLEVNLTLGTALIDMYSKCGSIQEAFSVFETMPIKDVYPWTAIINGLAMHGEALASLRLFYKMLNNGVRPNEATLIGVLSACSHGGLVDEGRELFGSMSGIYHIEPKVDHYGCMVDLLGRAGHLEEAVKLIKDMPMEPTPGVWGALFGACMIHKDYELGKQIGEHLIKIQPCHSGRYILLANLYSTCYSWEAAAHTRKLMKGKGVGKTPGCSWIELNGVIHEFVTFDSSHAESKSLYAVLDNIVSHSKFANCVPDTNLLMFDID